MTLTDTQLMLLSSASQREDHLITLPEKLKGGAARAVVSKLLIQSLVEEIAVGRDDPHWRRSEEDQPIGLKVTQAGLQAIGEELEDNRSDEDEVAGSEVADADRKAAESSAPRDGSKRALVISLLQQDGGVTLDDLVEATGWLPHTTRAALTGLRQKGYEVVRTKGHNGRSVYRITIGSQPATPVEPVAPEA
jgi:hypothetical protein